MSCINRNLPEVKKLSENLNISTALVAAKVGVWQSKNSIEDRFPTIEELNSKNETQFQTNQTNSTEGEIASEKTIRDLAARMSDRIGIPVKFDSDRTLNYKGKLENGVAYVNLAYATLDTPIHEILGHPIIRAIKNNNNEVDNYNNFMADYWDENPKLTRKEVEGYMDKTYEPNTNTTLYQNLVKELETGKGKEVLDRIKKDYNFKNNFKRRDSFILKGNRFESEGEVFKKNGKIIETKEYNLALKEINNVKYTSEEQQEEAIVELLGLMTAEKLSNTKDGKLISLLKRLLKEMKAFMRTLMNQKEVDIDTLPDNMTLGDISNLLAYSNSKLLLPGYEVEYTTPDNEKYKTYKEASNHISLLLEFSEEVDLSNVEIVNKEKNIESIPNIFVDNLPFGDYTYTKENNIWYRINEDNIKYKVDEKEVIDAYFGSDSNLISSFIKKNKEYEQSKEIIKNWKEINNIIYNPEEVYSRGQIFTSVMGAYSDFDVDLTLQNLLSHIEDNEKAGGEFAISAVTKPKGKRLKHLEGTGGKIRFNITPESNDILWASNVDAFSGSVWDASEKVNKDKKSELLGVSYTKYPAMRNVSTVQPNLASIIDNIAYHHNELGIVLKGNNFRLEYDEDIPSTTKKIIDSVNKILDQKYGKIVEPKIKKGNNKQELQNELFRLEQQQDELFATSDFESIDSDASTFIFDEIERVENEIKKIRSNDGINPTQTNETLKESIENIKKELNSPTILNSDSILDILKVPNEFVSTTLDNNSAIIEKNTKTGIWEAIAENSNQTKTLTESQVLKAYNKSIGKTSKKEYNSQALINFKIAALKEKTKKYPRSLIRSEVISSFNREEEYLDLPFQKVPSNKAVPFNLKESFINANLINKNNKILNKSKLNKAIEDYKDMSFFKYGFSVPDGTFKIINVGPNKSILRINEKAIRVIAKEAEINKEVENLTNNLKDSSNISETVVKKGSRKAKDKYDAYLKFLENNPQYENNEITFTKYAMAMLTNENSDKIDFSEETEAIEPLFQKVDTQTKQEKYSEKETSLKNSNEKLTSALEKSEIALKERIASLIHSAEMNKNKNKEKSQKLSQRADSLKEILLDLEKYRDKSKVTSALIFANEAKNNLSYLNNQLDNLDTNELSDLEFVLTFYENYIKSFSSIPVMKSVLSTYKARPDKSIEGIKDNELQEAIDVLTEVSTSFENVKNSFKDYQLSYVTKKLSDVKYFPNVEYRNRERLEKEYSANNIKGDKDTWVLRQMAGRDRERIQEEVEEEVNKLFNDPSKDISAMSASLGNGLKASDKLIQLYQHRLNEMQDREIQEDMEEDQRVKVLFRKLKDEKGSSNINKMFKNMLQFDSTGVPYLLSDYKLEVLEASKRMSTIRYKLQELEETDEEFNKLDKEYKALKTKYFVDKVDEFQVLDKYKNSYSNLSTIEKEVLDYFKSKNDEGNNTIYGRQGLNTYMYKNKNVVFYGLPKIYKSALERAYNGNILDEVKEGYKDLSTIRSDDVGFVNTEYDAAGKEVFKIPLHFRDGTGDNKMKAKDQSLDLFTIFRLEAKNINRYKNRREVELEFSTLLDVAYYKPIYLQKGSQNSKNVNTGKFEFTENAANSNMYKMLKNLNEQQFYDVLNKNGVKVPIVNLDANKVASKITGLASFVSLPLNLGQGFANVTNTKTQLFLESFIAGDIIKSKNIKNAEKFYAKHLGQTMADVTRPINESLVNQINEYFDLEGNLMGEAGDFLATTLAKKGLTKEARQVTQASGEHWIQSTMVLSILDGIAVRDKDYNYINKEGKIVATEKEAATMLEMFSQDKNKKLVVSDKVVFTKFNKLTEFNKGGKTKIKNLIDNKIYDIVGNYKQKTRAEVYRHWFGKLFGMFRKYFYDSFNRRFKNIDNVTVNKEDLREDQRTFNSSLQEYEEGFYTSLVRFILSAIKSREMGMQALKAHWGTLSQHEKANITQASGEFALTLVIIPLLTSLLSAAFDDDDSAVLGFTLYQMRRLEMELSQFYSIPELLKILKSPVPATRLFKDFGDTIGVLFEMGDVLNGEDLVDPENFDKFIKNVGKRTPGVKEFMKDYHKIYNLSNKSSLGF